MTNRTLAMRRLKALGCEKLPASVLKRILEDFEEVSAQIIERAVRRRITINKVAQALTHEIRAKKEQGVSHLLVLPLQDESNQLAGTNPILDIER